MHGDLMVKQNERIYYNNYGTLYWLKQWTSSDTWSQEINKYRISGMTHIIPLFLLLSIVDRAFSIRAVTLSAPPTFKSGKSLFNASLSLGRRTKESPSMSSSAVRTKYFL